MNRKGRKAGLAGLIIILVLSLAAMTWAHPGPAAAANPSAVFPDIEGDPNATFINYLAERGLIKGFPDGTFGPNQGLTRAQATSLLVKAAGLPADTSLPITFTDVKSDYWAAPSIAAATQAGYISGFPDGTFHPEENLTRAQGISLILRLSQQTGSVALPELTDIDSRHWAAPSVATGLASGMIGLTADNKQFLPDNIMSRSELARALGVLLTCDEKLYTGTLTGQLKITGGTVNVTQTGTQNPVTVTADTAISPGDIIQTDADGTAELEFPDGSGILIKENTALVVKEARGRAYIKVDGTAGTAVDWLVLDLQQGQMFGALTSNYESDSNETEEETAALNNDYSLVASLEDGLSLATAAKTASAPWWQAKQAKKVKVRVDMPWGVASIRGTFWQNIVQANGSSTTSLLTGAGQVTSGGQTVNIAAGQSTQITQFQAPPAPPVPMGPPQMQQWAQAGDWANQRAQEMQNQQEAPLPPAPPPGQLGAPPVQPPVQPPTPLPAPGITDLISSAIHNAAAASNPPSPPRQSSGGDRGSSSDNTPSVIPVSAVTVTPETMNLIAGGEAGTITATVTPADATNQNVAWSSSDTSVATVADGVVTPAAAGTATLTATTVDGGYSAATEVTVVGMARAVATGDFENQEELNAAISTMWSAAYTAGTFDATQVTQDYVDKMAAALSRSQFLDDVAVPAELVMPAGKTFASAQIKHDVNDELSYTEAVKVEANWGGRLIVWMNTNMAYGWSQPDDDEVVYTYVVTWEDETTTEYVITFKDADAPLVAALDASNSKVNITFSKNISEADIDTSDNWVPVVTFTDDTSYKLSILDSYGEYSMCLHSVDYTAGTNTLQINTPGAQSGTEYNLTVYEGPQFTSVKETHTFTFPEDEWSPAFINGYPAVNNNNITAYTAELVVQSDEFGSAYYVVLPVEEANAPQSTQEVKDWVLAPPEGLLSRSGQFGLYGDPGTITIEELESNSDYKIYVAIEDEYGNLVEEIRVINFHTLEPS